MSQKLLVLARPLLEIKWKKKELKHVFQVPETAFQNVLTEIVFYFCAIHQHFTKSALIFKMYYCVSISINYLSKVYKLIFIYSNIYEKYTENNSVF